jgi:hypothetical protein
MLKVGQTLIVRKAMPCQRESNGRQATIPQGQRITNLESAPDSKKVRFSAIREGQQETFSAFPLAIERCCALTKPVVPKAE